MFHVPNQHRLLFGKFATVDQDGNQGAFRLPSRIPGRVLFCIASDGLGWEHVSIHAEQGNKARTPTWDEMCQIKDLFWDAEDVVMQLHPAQSEYVNNHPNTLHLWRPTDQTIPTPPSIMVGLKGLEL